MQIMNHSSQKFNPEELNQMIEADDLKISVLRDNGLSYGTPTWIWVVAINGDMYVRAYNGVRSSWYKAAQTQKTGRIFAAGMVKEVVFETDIAPELEAPIDHAYKQKYSGSPYLSPMISARAKAATVRILPQ